jgi:N,N'-diacetyllegionaminate synthase
MVSFRELLSGPGGVNSADEPRSLIIGEVAQAHDGSLGMAHAFIDAIANAGADAVKFQTHIASAESTPGEPWRVPFKSQDVTRYDYWKRMEFTEDHWRVLKRHAEDRGILFLSSPFSPEAVDLLTRVGVAAWKVASGEVGNPRLFDSMAATGRPILISSGLSSIPELDAAVHRVKQHGLPLAVLQCTSMYPCPADKVGLNMIPLFRERYQCPVGLSDHSGTIYPSLAAIMLDVAVIEVHVALSREMFSPDLAASITTAELGQLVDGVRFIERMRAHPVDKNLVAHETKPLRDLFTKSVVVTSDLPAGTVLREEHLAAKKPGTGIPAARLTELIGRALVLPVRADQILDERDIERAS